MQTHIGADLHQRFCYLTAMDASGKTSRQQQVANEAEALRARLRKLARPRIEVCTQSIRSPLLDNCALLHRRMTEIVL